jgi:hypothetical protein
MGDKSVQFQQWCCWFWGLKLEVMPDLIVLAEERWNGMRSVLLLVLKRFLLACSREKEPSTKWRGKSRNIDRLDPVFYWPLALLCSALPGPYQLTVHVLYQYSSKSTTYTSVYTNIANGSRPTVLPN